MYVKRSTKYFSYVYALDCVVLLISYTLACLLRFGDLRRDPSYALFLILLLLCALVLDTATDNLRNFFTRGYYQEFVSVVKWWTIVILALLLFLFVTQNSAYFSRIFMGTFLLFGFAGMYGARIFFKRVILSRHASSSNGARVAVVTTLAQLPALVEHLKNTSGQDYQISHLALLDQDAAGTVQCGLPVTDNVDTLFDALRTEVLDEALLCMDVQDERLQTFTHNFALMGVTVHIALNTLNLLLPNARTEKFAGFPVLTTSNNVISHSQLLQKRIIDLMGSAVGLLLTVLAGIFIVPAICIESPGSPVYSQIRVGRNGRQFRMYKFRSMYRDADARKAQIAQQNKMSGLMFKVDNDPRITRVGRFLRRTSLDELPQFWNVLKGDMSLVGTRPPTLDEFEHYTLHHKSRLSFKPGITGMWQVSGRSDITDFEEVVRLDNEYIENWSIGLDLRILLETVGRVFHGSGAE